MLGLSLSKILFTALIIVVLWRGVRILDAIRRRLAQAQGEQREASAAEGARQRQAPGAATAPPRAAKEPVDLVACPRCGTYVPNGTICRSEEECIYKDKK